MNSVYPGKMQKVLILLGDMIADMINNKNLNPLVTGLFIRGRKLKISLVFIMPSYFEVSKYIKLSYTHNFIMKIPNRRDLQQIAINHSSNVDFKDFTRFYKKCTRKSYSFLVIDDTLAKDEKLQYNIIRAVAKIPTLSSGKLDKYEYLTSKKFYALQQHKILEGA